MRQYKIQAFLVIAYLFVFAGYFDEALAKSYSAEQIYNLPPRKIAQYIESTKGRRKVILIYTSWCPHCRKALPDFINLEKALPGSVIAISEDENYIDFAAFSRKLKSVPFRMIVVRQGKGPTLSEELQKFGAQPYNGYPTMILMDENNKVVSGQGNLLIDNVVTYILGKDPKEKPTEGAEQTAPAQ